MKYICCLRTTSNYTGLETVPLCLVKTFAEKEWIVSPSLFFIYFQRWWGLLGLQCPPIQSTRAGTSRWKKREASRPGGSNHTAPPLTQPWAGSTEKLRAEGCVMGSSTRVPITYLPTSGSDQILPQSTLPTVLPHG